MDIGYKIERWFIYFILQAATLIKILAGRYSATKSYKQSNFSIVNHKLHSTSSINMPYLGL